LKRLVSLSLSRARRRKISKDAQIVKTCKVHGELDVTQVNMVCKACVCLRAKEWDKKNPERVKETDRKWYQNNIEKVRAKGRSHLKKLREKNPDKLKTRLKRTREWHRNSVNNLNDYYVKQKIIRRGKNGKLRCSDIPASLVDFKREVLKLKRAIKEQSK